MNTENLSGHTFIRIDTVDSTNNFAAKLLKADLCQNGTVIMADFQTKGKGQRGQSWESEMEKNLTILGGTFNPKLTFAEHV